RRRHTRCSRDWSSDVCSSDLAPMRTSLTNAVTGPSCVMGPMFVPHWNSGRFDTGAADGDTLGLAVVTPVPTFEVGRRSGLATNRSEERRVGNSGDAVMPQECQ